MAEASADCILVCVSTRFTTITIILAEYPNTSQVMKEAVGMVFLFRFDRMLHPVISCINTSNGNFHLHAVSDPSAIWKLPFL
jgi:hypothetical protein